MDAAFACLVVAVMSMNAGAQPESDARPASAKRHTSYFSDPSGWSSDPSSPPAAAAPTYDRYGFGTTSNPAAISAPPSVIDRTQSAVTETSKSLRDGVEAGIQQANQQISQGSQQMIDSARSAGQQLSNQFQGWAGTASQPAQITAPAATSTSPQATGSFQRYSNPFTTSTAGTSAAAVPAPKAQNGLAPPPNWGGSDAAGQSNWTNGTGTTTAAPRSAALTAPPVQTATGWTSVHSTVAPPALMKPRLVNTVDTATPFAATSASTPPLQPMVGDGGPNFPVTTSASQTQERSVLAQSQSLQPPPAAASANENWGLGWDGNTTSQPAPPATAGTRYDAATVSSGAGAARDIGFATPQQPVNQAALGQSQGSQPAQTFGIGAFDRSSWPENPSPVQTVSIAAVTPSAPAGSTGTVGLPQNAATTEQPATTVSQVSGTAPSLPPSEQLPWLPLLVVSLGLAGSIGANLFLGYSYADARHRYRTLVQKTAHKFRRAVAA